MASSANNNSVGKWEVVKKNKKQNGSAKSQADKKSGGGGRKALSESNLPRVEPYPAAVKMSETIFENFEKIGKKQNKEQVPPPAEAQQKKPNGGKQSKKSPSSGSFKQTHYKTLEEAVKALDVVELRHQLEKSQALFPENSSVWVKDLAGYLNSKLLAPDTDPTLSSYAHDYPYCLAGKELRNIIKNLLGKSGAALEDSFDYCVFTMLRELDKHPGEPLHGYRMCIQAIMMTKPKIATQNLSEHLELLRSHQNRPAKCQSIMWALGQAGFCELSQGIKVWLGIMLPVLGMKTLSAYAVSYLERLLMVHANLTKGFGVMGPKEFFPLLDFAYMPKNSLSASLQGQLRRLYPRLKVLAFGAKPESTLHTYFPSFLSRATPSCPDAMKRELLSSLTECLSVDVQSLGVWRQLYTKHLTQSSLLLSHLLTSWNTLSPKLRNSLQETIQSFRVTNEEIRTTANVEDVRECNAVCSSLQMKIHSQGFPWSRLLLAVLVFAAGFIAHDVRSHGTFSQSTTALYLEKSGAPAVSLQAWKKVSHYSQKGVSWLAETTPYYYSLAVEAFGPTLEGALEKLKVAAVIIAQRSSEIILWVQETTPLLIEWVRANTPESVFQFLEFVKELLVWAHQNYVLPAVQYVLMALQQSWQALQDSCNGDVSLLCMQNHMVALTNSTWTYLQDTTTAIRSWAQELLSRA
ncbi:transmembrane protein 214 isoform X1 [Electrophorus electricus]|uniref:transmembrane protein 214 isoform X1 n=1 Tax=Electrophorus electricus TaxID=8005 RepID=UPI0015D0CFF5|nr:transmembrane protein 214 isoform X1 [Electrophorus electricus]